MGQTTSIQWTDVTWNPIRGCSRVSQGCVNCYAERQAARFAGPGKPFEGFVHIVNDHPAWTGKIALVEKHIYDPLHWSKPRRVFVNSMSDLFHESLDVQDLLRVFCVMQEAEQHEFQVLTKRADRMAFLVPWMRQALAEDYERWNGGHFRWPLPNVWLGVSVEDEQTANERIPRLLRTPAAVRFVSYEPALEAVNFRRWFNAEAKTARRDGISGRRGRGAIDSWRRHGLEAHQSEGQPVGRGHESDSARPEESGASIRKIFSSSGDVRRTPLCDVCPSTGLEILPGTDSGRLDSEPQERREDRQPDRESGVGNKLGASDPRDSPVGMGRSQEPAISWVIIGGESGPDARPFDIQWASSTIAQCKAAGVACFVKQLGANPFLSRDADGAFCPDYEYRFQDRKGGDMEEWPEDLRVREFPVTAA